MPSLRRPGRERIAAFLAARRAREGAGAFSYEETGATSALDAPLPARLAGRYDLDHHRVALGRGRERFARACEALFAWRHFEVPGVALHGAGEPAHEGQVVATLVSVAGLWFLNPCRVVYARQPGEEADRAAFAYGTLPGHVERGEERFAVSFDAATGEVHYEIAAFSRPAMPIVWLARPFVRRIQRRFALATGEALRRAIASPLAG